MRIVTRGEWGAQGGTGPARGEWRRIGMPSPRLWLHHTATDSWHGPDGVRACQRFHIETRDWNDVGYSFLVDTDGTVYEGRGAGIAGAHTEGDNLRSHAVTAMGDFSRTRPPTAMLQAIVDLAAHGYRSGWWPPGLTGGHRDAPGAQTACPGGFLHEQIPHLNAAIAAQLAGDDMFDDADRERLATVEEKLNRLLDAVAGWQPGRKDRSLIGRIGDHLKVQR